MILLDTHVLLWWALDPDQLSDRARNVCRKMERNKGFVSSISFWELGIKLKNKKLDIGISIEEFTSRIKQTGAIEIVPVDEQIWLKNLSLKWAHRDPADRTIVATAMLKEVPVLSKDAAVLGYKPARCIW